MSEAPAAKRDRARPSPAPEAAPPAGSPVFGRLADGALVCAFLALTFLFGVFPLKDTDFWWHLKTGDLIRQTGRVPTHDIYTFTVPNHEWIDLHWGFEVALSWVYGLGGVPGTNLAKCVVTCAAVLLLVTARRRDWPLSVMLLAWLPALFVLSGRMYVRPETVSLLYLSIYLAVLFRWDRWPALAFVLPAVQVLWVNTQGIFVLGPIVLSFALIDAALRPGAFQAAQRRWWRTVGVAVGLTGLACFVNPYGIRGALFPIQLAQTMRNPVFSETIAELTPIPVFVQRAGWMNLPLRLHLVTLILGGLSFLIPLFWRAAMRARQMLSAPPETKARKRRRGARPPALEQGWRLSPFRLLLYACFSLLSMQATRNSHQFAAVVGTVTAWNFGEWAAAVRQQRAVARKKPAADAREPAQRDVPLRLGALLAIALAFAAVATGWFYRQTGEGRTIGLGEEPLWYPHAAIDFCGQPGMPDRFMAFHFGHASLYEYRFGPERKVFADARLEVMGPEMFSRYVELQRAMGHNDPGWDRELRDLKQPVVLIDHTYAAPAGASMLAQGHWKCVWFDPIVSVFLHESYADMAQAYTVDFGARHFRPDPATDPRGVAEWLASSKALLRYAGELEKLGRRQLGGPLVELGLDYARRVVRTLPGNPEGWRRLGHLELARESRTSAEPIPRFRMAFNPVIDLPLVRATYAFRQAIERGGDDFLTLLALDMAYRLRGMSEAEADVLERLVRLSPADRQQEETQSQSRGQLEVVRAELGPLPSQTPPPNRNEHDRLVAELLASGRAATAADLLERDYPPAARAWELTDRIATLRLHLGEPARARAVWQEAKDPPSHALQQARVAVTYLVEQNFEAARAAYREALQSDPSVYEALYGLALLEQDAGRATEALANATQAVAHAPNDVSKTAAQQIATWVGLYADRPAAARAEGASQPARSTAR